MQAVQSHTPTTIPYLKDFKVDFTMWGSASGVYIREPWTDTGSEIALASSGRWLMCGLNHLKPYDSSEDKSERSALPRNTIFLVNVDSGPAA